MWRIRDFVRSEACGNHTFCDPAPYARPKRQNPNLSSTQPGIVPHIILPPSILPFIVSHSDPDLAHPAVPDSADRTQDHRQGAAGIQAAVGIHRAAAAGTGNLGADHREVGMAPLEGGQACRVRVGRAAWAFRGRLGVGSCLGGEACRALGAFRACRRVVVGRLEER